MFDEEIIESRNRAMNVSSYISAQLSAYLGKNVPQNGMRNAVKIPVSNSINESLRQLTELEVRYVNQLLAFLEKDTVYTFFLMKEESGWEVAIRPQRPINPRINKDQGDHNPKAHAMAAASAIAKTAAMTK